MSLKENLKHFRTLSKLSQEALSEKSGVSQQVIGDVESGRTKKPRDLHRLATALGVGVADLDPDRFGPPLPEAPPAARVPAPPLLGRRDLPVFGVAEGGQGSVIITFEPIDYVARPSALDNVRDAYCIYITGDSMAPAYEAGDLAWVHPHLPPSPDRYGIFFKKDSDGEVKSALIKRIVRATAKDWHVRQYNPAKDFTLARDEWPKCDIVIGKFNR